MGDALAINKGIAMLGSLEINWNTLPSRKYSMFCDIEQGWGYALVPNKGQINAQQFSNQIK